MYHKKWFQTLVGIILVCLLFWVLKHIEYVYQPIFTYVGAIAFPLITAGVLYYISRPIVHLLERYRVHRILAIFCVFILFIITVYLIVTFIAPIAQEQFTRFVDNLPAMIREVESIINYWQSNQEIIPDQFSTAITDAQNEVFSRAQEITGALTSFVIGMVTSLVQFLFLLILVPFFLFYMLKDGEKLQPFLAKFFKDKRAASLTRLFKRIDHTLSSFIQGQLTVSFCVGVLLFIGYTIIGLHYSLSLALFGMATNVIPFAGPYLAVIPAILAAFFQDPFMIWYVIIIMVVAQQIEGNLISPNVMGKALSIHPLTIITLILAAGSIAGFLGLLFVIPFYAVVKTIIGHFYEEAFDGREI